MLTFIFHKILNTENPLNKYHWYDTIHYVRLDSHSKTNIQSAQSQNQMKKTWNKTNWMRTKKHDKVYIRRHSPWWEYLLT